MDEPITAEDVHKLKKKLFDRPAYEVKYSHLSYAQAEEQMRKMRDALRDMDTLRSWLEPLTVKNTRYWDMIEEALDRGS